MLGQHPGVTSLSSWRFCHAHINPHALQICQNRGLPSPPALPAGPPWLGLAGRPASLRGPPAHSVRSPRQRLRSCRRPRPLHTACPPRLPDPASHLSCGRRISLIRAGNAGPLEGPGAPASPPGGSRPQLTARQGQDFHAEKGERRPESGWEPVRMARSSGAHCTSLHVHRV